MSSFDDVGFRQSTADVAADNRPLTEREIQSVRRLLSDPFSFPLEFKSWLVAYLESSDMSLPMSAILGLTKTLGISGAGQGTLGIFPAGLILPFAADTAPVGSLLCDGASYPRAAQHRLWTAIGLHYTVGDDGVSFSVPDLRGRVPVGIGPHADHAAVGTNEGSLPADRRSRHPHGHNITQTYQDKNLLDNPGSTDASGDSYPIFPFSGGSDGAQPSGGTVGPVGTSPDTPAFLTLNFIIVA